MAPGIVETGSPTGSMNSRAVSLGLWLEGLTLLVGAVFSLWVPRKPSEVPDRWWMGRRDGCFEGPCCIGGNALVAEALSSRCKSKMKPCVCSPLIAWCGSRDKIRCSNGDKISPFSTTLFLTVALSGFSRE